MNTTISNLGKENGRRRQRLGRMNYLNFINRNKSKNVDKSLDKMVYHTSIFLLILVISLSLLLVTQVQAQEKDFPLKDNQEYPTCYVLGTIMPLDDNFNRRQLVVTTVQPALFEDADICRKLKSQVSQTDAEVSSLYAWPIGTYVRVIYSYIDGEWVQENIHPVYTDLIARIRYVA